MLYLIYRGSVSFLITTRSDGELVDNSQVLLMMKLALSVIWISVIQHILIASPLSTLFSFHLEETTEMNDSEHKIEDISQGRQDNVIDLIKDWVYAFMVRTPKDENDRDSLLHSENKNRI